MDSEVATELSKNEVQSAIDDFEQRTLSCVPSALERLIYIASLRDYNTGLYAHEGLLARYEATVVQKALATCHQNVFESVVRLNIRDFLEEVTNYFSGAGRDRLTVLRSWQRLRAYQTLKPMDCTALSGDLFDSNMKVALIMLHLMEIKSHEA